SGMITLNQSLLNLVQRKYIGVEEAIGRCSELDEFRTMLNNAGISVRDPNRR
ncbi:MAG: type IV pili twitching motility protein PilT, partial [Deltaproteobacteria bacterium]|nr:type IV pili twitching motility protein PilT [Deltaproteobacteria bacterium]